MTPDQAVRPSVGKRVECAVCGKQKNPIGRDAPMGAFMCNFECPGYRQEPYPMDLWPGETREEFGY